VLVDRSITGGVRRNDDVTSSDRSTSCGVDRLRRPSRRRAVTLVEVLVVLAVIAIVAGIAALDVRPLNHEARNAASEFASIVRQVRARAMATTSAYRLVLVAGDRVAAETRATCGGSEPWTSEPRLEFRARDGTRVVAGAGVGDEIACFNSRGIASASPEVTFRDGRGREASVTILAGGAVRGP
jgi:prepilin-type N-terminal cleavage/methylation domain-containing protein